LPPIAPGAPGSFEFQSGYKLAQLKRKARSGALRGDDALDFVDNELVHNAEKAAREFSHEKARLLSVAKARDWAPLPMKIRKPTLKALKRLRRARNAHAKFVEEWQDKEPGESLDPKG
jgi:hypothetical protein